MVTTKRHQLSILEKWAVDWLPGEEQNLLKQHPERAKRMHKALREWQHSVINSIRGGDY